MLRFDVPPVWSNVTRWEAFLTFAFCLLAYLVSPWLFAPLVVQGFIRGFMGHFKEPLHGAWTRFFKSQGWAGQLEDTGANMFANKILFIASTAGLLLFLADSVLWQVPCAALLIFSTLEWAFSFCIACWAYGIWYRHFPPHA